jgi:hypothetical protein
VAVGAPADRIINRANLDASALGRLVNEKNEIGPNII